MIKRITILTLISVLWTVMLHAQSDMKNAYRIEGSSIVLLLDNVWPRTDQEKLLDQCGMKGLSLDTLWRFGSLGRWAMDGWKLTKTGTNRYKIYKNLSELSGNMKYKDVVLSNEALEKLRTQTFATYGFNSFRKQSVITSQKGKTRFFLFGKLDAHDVFLSGTFHAWSTGSTPMTRTDSGWVAEVTLRPGKHCYKFIVNGQWMSDPQNLKKEDDFHGGYNSVYFVTNEEFNLKGYTNAQRVIVSGSFNNWNEREISLKKVKGGWKLPVYLNDGEHGYKFLVDGSWMNDPANPVIRDDGNGNKNSYLCLGDTLFFRLNGYTNASSVIVAGDFNGWNERALSLKRSSKGWELPHVLAAGNYQYKYIVDGQWMIDPQNPHTGTQGGHQNSILAVKPNYTFKLNGYPNAKEVQVAGNFTDWNGYTMKKTKAGWEIEVSLKPGKYIYKFIVDGTWIIDPANKLWEQNEYGTGNSVMWFGTQ